MKLAYRTIIFSIIISFFFTSVVFAADKDDKTWVPTQGYAFAQNGSFQNSVFMYADFYWSSESRMSGLKDDTNETLEMDIVFYNYDGKGYSYEWYKKSGNNYRGTYWETNQPRPYVDTQFDDSYNERAFTIGSSDANQFKAKTQYYWWAYGNKNSNGSKTKLSVQRGYRFPSGSYENPFAVFAEETKILVPFSNWNTPGAKNWTF